MLAKWKLLIILVTPAQAESYQLFQIEIELGSLFNEGYWVMAYLDKTFSILIVGRKDTPTEKKTSQLIKNSVKCKKTRFVKSKLA